MATYQEIAEYVVLHGGKCGFNFGWFIFENQWGTPLAQISCLSENKAVGQLNANGQFYSQIKALMQTPVIKRDNPCEYEIRLDDPDEAKLLLAKQNEEPRNFKDHEIEKLLVNSPKFGEYEGVLSRGTIEGYTFPVYKGDPGLRLYLFNSIGGMAI